jgi:hypothetical protein
VRTTKASRVTGAGGLVQDDFTNKTFNGILNIDNLQNILTKFFFVLLILKKVRV